MSERKSMKDLFSTKNFEKIKSDIDSSVQSTEEVQKHVKDKRDNKKKK